MLLTTVGRKPGNMFPSEGQYTEMGAGHRIIRIKTLTSLFFFFLNPYLEFYWFCEGVKWKMCGLHEAKRLSAGYRFPGASQRHFLSA